MKLSAENRGYRSEKSLREKLSGVREKSITTRNNVFAINYPQVNHTNSRNKYLLSLIQ